MNGSYVCSVCGAAAAYDGRCGDGPYLTCECSRHTAWVPDRCGGYTYNTLGAEPVPGVPGQRKTTVIKNGNETIIIIEKEKNEWPSDSR